MPRARNIKPAFFKNENLAELPFETRLLFIGLWSLADKAGRLEDRPKRVKMELFAADDVDVDTCLSQLAAGTDPFLIRYEANGKRLLQIVHWDKHQRPHHQEKESELPAFAPTCDEAPTRERAGSDEGANQFVRTSDSIALIPDPLNQIPDTGLLIPDSDESKYRTSDHSFDAFWAAFPAGRKSDKKDAHKAWKTAIKEAKPVVLVAAAKEYANSEVGQGEFVKGPATWLRKGCWTDDREAWRSKSRGRSESVGQQQLLNGRNALEGI